MEWNSAVIMLINVIEFKSQLNITKKKASTYANHKYNLCIQTITSMYLYVNIIVFRLLNEI